MKDFRAILAGIWRERDGKFGLICTLAVLMFALLGPVLGQDANHIAIPSRFMPPGFSHLLGTDNLGRDLFARLSTGARSALTIAVAIVFLSSLIGAVIGVTAGLAGGWIDRVITMAFDIISAFPALILAFALVALYGTGFLNFLILVTIVFIPQFGRMARSRSQSLRHQSFVEAEQLLGVHPVKIMARHILPNVVAPLIVLASMNIPVVITFEAGLSFLGLGVQPPTSSLGTLIKDGFIYMDQSWWPTVGAAGILALATLGSTLLGEALRRVLDPKAQGGIL